LAQAIDLLASTLKDKNDDRSHRTKVREPDTYDGVDPLKLRPFLVQCQLNFNDRPNAFLLDSAKVNFALSYLKGLALSWFEPYLLERTSDTPPEFFDNYELFSQELQTNFGPHDPKGNAETDIENLVMKDEQRIAKYIVNFNRLATQTGWDPVALRHAFYRGLPDRIKDQLCNIGKPTTLVAMKDLAQAVDSRYWDRKNEQSRGARKVSSAPSSSASNKNPNHSPKTSPQKPSDNSASSTSTPKSPPAYADKLDKNGKLKATERQRRIDNKLCIICGGPGHMARDCKKAKYTPARTSARAATVHSDAHKEPEK
jgi:hypothetical protein